MMGNGFGRPRLFALDRFYMLPSAPVFGLMYFHCKRCPQLIDRTWRSLSDKPDCTWMDAEGVNHVYVRLEFRHLWDLLGSANSP